MDLISHFVILFFYIFLFQAPQPLSPWDGVKKATSHGPVCPQKDIFTEQIILGNEDCLHLNVYTKNMNSEKPLPVMVFIHGGGYRSGSGNENMYGPDFLVNHDVVLVTINYRLEAFGFLCLDTEDVPGNAGLKDQNAALRWVKENIANFGGNPNNVTIFGESAGGASVIYHMLSPMSKGLFNRAISMSGVPTCDWSLAFRPKERAFILGKLLGLETRDPKELLKFLQSVPAEKLINTDPVVLGTETVTNNIVKMYHFTPVIEKDVGLEHFLTQSPLKVIKNRTFNEVDLFIGHTSEESLIGMEQFKTLIPHYNRYRESLVPRELLLKCNPDTILEIATKIHQRYFGNKFITLENVKEFVKYVNETGFIYDIHRVLYHLNKINNKKVFMYKFSCVSERNLFGNQGKQYGITGASHLDDVLYLFDPKEHNLKIEKGSKEYNLVQLVNTVFTNFAKYG